MEPLVYESGTHSAGFSVLHNYVPVLMYTKYDKINIVFVKSIA